jgi:bacteriorhodopsin
MFEEIVWSSSSLCHGFVSHHFEIVPRLYLHHLITLTVTISLRLHPSDTMDNDLSNTAEIFLWLGFSAMFGSFVVFYAMLRTTAPGNRLFHNYTCAIVGFAATAYLWMALGKYKREHTNTLVFATIRVITQFTL